jgi:formylglycine-generating enzyme required for sulfatase activity
VPIAAADTLGYDFRMGKYPVTNAQYRRFFDEGGYAEDRSWWTEEAVKELAWDERLAQRTALLGRS